MDEEYEAEPSYKWRWSFLAIRLLTFVASLFGVTGRLFGGFAEDLTAHANYKTERKQFEADAGRELEALTRPEEG